LNHGGSFVSKLSLAKRGRVRKCGYFPCASSYDLRQDGVSYDVVLNVIHGGDSLQVFMRPKMIICEEGFLEFGSRDLNCIFDLRRKYFKTKIFQI
jgi:hypothetical protein